MTTLGSASRRIRFDGFEADLHTGELRRSGRKLRLPNQSFQVLAMLLDKAGQLVTREELRARLWPSGTFVEYDQSLNAAVNRLREALHDSADRPRYIETLPKRGYRFIGTVESDVAGDLHAANAGVGGGGDAEARAGAGGHRRGKAGGEPRGKAGGDLHGKAGGDSRGEARGDLHGKAGGDSRGEAGGDLRGKAGGDSRGRAGGEPRVGTLAGDWKPSPESRDGVASEGAVASERAVASEGAVASADAVASAGGVAFERAVAPEGAVAPAPAVAPGGLVVAAGVLVAGDPMVPESPSSGARQTSVATGLTSGDWAPGAAGAVPGPASPDGAGLRVGQLATGRRFGTRRMGLVLFAVVAAVVLVAGATFMLGRRSVAVSDLPPHREVVPFTSLPGQEVAPTFSPDGSHIAFAWNGETGDDRLFDLYVKEIGSERLLRLTRSAAKAMVPAWSPDGGAIAFVRWTENNAAIFVIPALGGPERLVVSRQVAVGHLIRISWSPDGKRIAYPAYGHTGSQRIYLVSLDTLQSEPLRRHPNVWMCWSRLSRRMGRNSRWFARLAGVCTRFILWVSQMGRCVG